MADVLSTAEAAQIIGVKKSTLAVWRWRGKGPRWTKLAGGRSAGVYYDRDEILRWLRDR